MEYYSASLWHLEKATELSVLADDLRHADTLRPETWCIMGNLMSLTKDHEAAIKFIERAIQITPIISLCYDNYVIVSIKADVVHCVFCHYMLLCNVPLIGVSPVCLCLSVTES